MTWWPPYPSSQALAQTETDTRAGFTEAGKVNACVPEIEPELESDHVGEGVVPVGALIDAEQPPP